MVSGLLSVSWSIANFSPSPSADPRYSTRISYISLCFCLHLSIQFHKTMAFLSKPVCSSCAIFSLWSQLTCTTAWATAVNWLTEITCAGNMTPFWPSQFHSVTFVEGHKQGLYGELINCLSWKKKKKKHHEITSFTYLLYLLLLSLLTCQSTPNANYPFLSNWSANITNHISWQLFPVLL